MNQPAFIHCAYAATASASATDTATGYAPADALIATEDPGVAWKPANTTGAKSYTIYLDGPQVIDCLALLGRGLNGITLEVRGSTDNFSTSNVQLSAGAALVGSCIAWRKWTNSTAYRCIRLNFSGFGSDFLLMYACPTQLQPLPYHADGHDPDVIQAETKHLLSPQKMFLGTTQQNATRPLSLDWGQLTDAEYAPFAAWADNCVATSRPFFYVPDIDQSTVYFGWTDEKYKFSAPYKNGLRDIGKIPFTARVT